MRGGVLLCEETPTQLMITHNCNNLEQAFLQLSHKQHNAFNEEDDQVLIAYLQYCKQKLDRNSCPI